MAGLSAARVATLRPLLDGLVQHTDSRRRIGFDPIEFPRRYHRPADIEVAALLCASLAYGRADLFRPKLFQLLAPMGESPARYVTGLTVLEAARVLRGFVYRFNLPADMAVLLLGMGAVIRRHGSLESLFLRHLQRLGLKGALGSFTRDIREAAPRRDIELRLGPVRGLSHLLPASDGAGASKRLNLFLRWMVRGPDEVDLGVWRRVSPSSLLIPLDTHIGRLSHHLGLTGRTDLSWKTAEEITSSLRQLDPVDPVRYDFALCHFGMSGRCPARVDEGNCRRCPLRSECRIGKRIAVDDRRTVRLVP